MACHSWVGMFGPIVPPRAGQSEAEHLSIICIELVCDCPSHHGHTLGCRALVSEETSLHMTSQIGGISSSRLHLLLAPGEVVASSATKKHVQQLLYEVATVQVRSARMLAGHKCCLTTAEENG